MVDREATLYIEQRNIFLGKPTYRSNSLFNTCYYINRNSMIFHNHIAYSNNRRTGGGRGWLVRAGGCIMILCDTYSTWACLGWIDLR